MGVGALGVDDEVDFFLSFFPSFGLMMDGRYLSCIRENKHCSKRKGCTYCTYCTYIRDVHTYTVYIKNRSKQNKVFYCIVLRCCVFFSMLRMMMTTTRLYQHGPSPSKLYEKKEDRWREDMGNESNTDVQSIFSQLFSSLF